MRDFILKHKVESKVVEEDTQHEPLASICACIHMWCLKWSWWRQLGHSNNNEPHLLGTDTDPGNVLLSCQWSCLLKAQHLYFCLCRVRHLIDTVSHGLLLQWFPVPVWFVICVSPLSFFMFFVLKSNPYMGMPRVQGLSLHHYILVNRACFLLENTTVWTISLYIFLVYFPIIHRDTGTDG